MRRGAAGPATRARVAAGLAATALAAVTGAGVVVAPAQPAVAQDGQWWHTAWQMSQVWQITDGSGVTVAVVDSGVDASVPDLAGAVVPGIDLSGSGTDGRVDTGESGHGTGMASLIASRGTGTGVVGVAPGATILPINVGAPEVRTNDHALHDFPQAIRYAADQGAAVVNVSQGAYVAGPEPCPQPVADAVRYAIDRGVVVVASTRNKPDDPPAFPESCPGVLTVGALTADLEPWASSGRNGHVDVAAPGVGISAVIPGGSVIQADGTSNATALVSGVVALLRAAFPDASAYELVARLLATVEDVGPPGPDLATGYGMVRPYQALTASVPANAPNPIFDELSVSAPTGAAGEPFVPPQPPTVAVEEPGSPGISPTRVALLLCLLFVIASMVALPVVWIRHRRSPSPRRQPVPPPPLTAAPPPRPGPPTGSPDPTLRPPE